MPQHTPGQMELTEGYTPGPWTWPHFVAEDIDCNCGFMFSATAELTIAKLYFNSGDEYDEQYPDKNQAIANAKLIASAPDMAAELATLRQKLKLAEEALTKIADFTPAYWQDAGPVATTALAQMEKI